MNDGSNIQKSLSWLLKANAELMELVVMIASKAIAARRVGSSPTFGILTFGLTAVQDVRETALDD